MTTRRRTTDEGDLRSGGRKSPAAMNRPDHARRSVNYRMSGTAGGGLEGADRLSGTGNNAAAAAALANGSAFGGADPTRTVRPAEPEPIRVVLRLRPQNKLENSKRGKSCVEIHKGSTKITVDAPLEGECDFSFDRVFGDRAGQADVYDGAVEALAQKTMDGLDTALVAFGQTGSGKTHTMMGTGWENGIGRKLGGDGDNASSAVDTDLLLTNEDGKKIPMELGEDTGMIPRLLRDMYQRMAKASHDTEFTVRVSYVEIYMEKVLDLLNPTNRSLEISYDTSEEEDAATREDDDTDVQMGGGVRIKGASELCCLNETDALALLARGNAYRKLSSNDMCTESNLSHSVLIIRLEQKDSETGRSKTSRVLFADLAGSEMADKKATQTRPDQSKGNGEPSQKEAKMINRSFSSLTNVVKALVEQQQLQTLQDESGASTAVAVPYQKSKLTRVLRHAFGGRCSTTMVLAGSPSSFSISETIGTIRFGQKCRRVRNRPQICLDLSPVEYRKHLAASERRQTELMSFVKALAGECRSLKTEGLRGRLSEATHRGPIWDSIDTILEESDKDEAEGLASRLAAIGQRSKGGAAALHTGPSQRHSISAGAEVTALREELEKAEEELAAAKKDAFLANQARNKAESVLGEIQSEAAALRTQNDNLSAEKKRNMQDLIDTKNEIQVLSQRKLEVEHNLRVSQFRENEATVFLRQFRRFYRRLLRNKAAQGTGSTGEITAKVPGVPDLNDLIDVDTLLLESGLIEEEELRDDALLGTYRPSSQALLRSTSAAKKAVKEAAALEKAGDGPVGASIAESLGGIAESGGSAGNASGADGGEDVDESLGDNVPVQSILSGNASDRLSALSITARQQALQTPSGRLISMREKDLERDLLQMTERCIELQISLNEEKANVDVLTNRTGSLSKKRLAQEAISLRQALDRKTHDLQAIIWKMNELHLINKTYNEKMTNREQHVTYLEENLVDLQNTNRRMISDQQDADTKLRSDLGEMKDLVETMTFPLWQFGEGSSEHCLASRIIIPVRGGPYPDGVNWMASPKAEGVHESNDDGEVRKSPTPLHNERPSVDDKKSAADKSISVAYGSTTESSPPNRNGDKVSDGTGLASEAKAVEAAGMNEAAVRAKPPFTTDENGSTKPLSKDHLKHLEDGGGSDSFIGGKDVSYPKRRFVHKLGPQIRNGVLKEGKKTKKSEGGSAPSGSGTRRSSTTKVRPSSARTASATSGTTRSSRAVAKD